MLKTILSFLTASTILALSANTLSAQKSDFTRLEGLPPLEEGDLTCRVISTYKPTNDKLYYVSIGSKFYVAPIISETLSQAIPIRGKRIFTLYQKIENEEGEEIQTPVVTAELKGSGSNFLVILSKNQEEPISSKVVDLAPSKLAANKVHLINLSPVALGMQVEDTQHIAQLGQRVSHNFKTAARNSYTSAQVIMRYQGENKIMGSKRLRLIPGRRVIIVCFASAKRAKMGATPLGMVTIQDIPK